MKKSIHIQEQIEIHAPAEEVFAILTDPEKHLQLGPNWGHARLERVSDDYPQSGSSYQLIPVREGELPYSTFVMELDWLREIAFRIEDDSQSTATWKIEAQADAVRLNYQAEFQLDAKPEEAYTTGEESGDALQSILNRPESFEHQVEVARREAVEWLTSIKRYAELRETRLRLWLRWLMDRFILRLRSDQRRIILALIAMQLITFLTFVAAVVGIGLVSLIF